MSRSNPSGNNPHPAMIWLEWDGTNGNFRYWDKEKEEKVGLPPDFTFLLLDQTASITGFSQRHKTGLYSNEVRDTRTELLTVKLHKSNGKPLAQGVYSEIKDSVFAAGGKFTSNCYVAIKVEGKLEIAVVQMRGASITPWFEFVKENRKAIWEKAVRVRKFTDEKSGKNEYKAPVFELAEVSKETQESAITLDKQVQEYLKDYFGRRQAERVDTAPKPAPVSDNDGGGVDNDGPPESDDVPF